MVEWWYLILMTIDLIRAQNPFSSEGGFLADPFLELTAGVTTSIYEKSTKSDSTCISNGALAGSIIGTLILSAFIAFLIWVIYLRQKLQEVQLYKNQRKKQESISSQHHRTNPSLSKYGQQNNKQYTNNNHMVNQLPLDVADYKFGTFPFRQSQTPSVNGHYNHADWLSRAPSSFHSVTMDQDTETIDIELLNPTFCGLNFSITGNMRAGIFVKDILDKETSQGHIKLNSSDQLRTGDRIIALTICFQSIVYEDALTILSYASPYPVILRVQRPIHATKIDILTEKRLTTINSSNKVKWRDDFEHYDNDTLHNRSITQQDPSITLMTDTKSFSSTTHPCSPSKITHHNKPSSSSTTKGNKLKTVSNTVGVTTKSSDLGIKKHRDKTLNQKMLTTTGLTAIPIDKISTPPIPTNKTTMKSVTNAVISYLHYRGANTGHTTDMTNNSEATLMPYYDSPYDYYGAQISQPHLNKNNNNNYGSTESLTPVTSIYTIHLSSIKSNALTQRAIIPRRCERRLSSPAAIVPITFKKVDDNDISLENIDTFV
ncbi:unnamed protein product [Rotaria sordida]|uniref:PDZ domain-containing protein n=2 Tax=Rotaria sordida TaxID=392033 RepID=A0A814EWE8_9BILA|nr:unnamed protein product [Rotaria sordida]CAF4000441.1 unnamed protein product [Rotaria sordida]